MKQILFFLICLNLFSFDPEYSKRKNELPLEIKDMKIVEKLGDKIPLDLVFKNEDNRDISLNEIFSKGKPVLLTIIYYRCPTLCGYHMVGIQNVLKDLDFNAGEEFQYVAVSMDANETPELAKLKRKSFIDDYSKSKKSRNKTDGWYFLTGKEESIQKLASSVGFPFRYNLGLKQWIHPAVAYIVTPEGKLSRYLHGISFDARDMKLSFMAAGNGKIGNFIDQFTMYCFKFDPDKNKYVIYAYNIMRIGGAVTVLLLSIFLYSFWRTQTRKKLIQGET